MAASGALSKIGTALLLVLGLLSQCASLTASAASGPHPVASSASKSDSIAGAFAIGLASYAQPLAAEGLKLGQYFRGCTYTVAGDGSGTHQRVQDAVDAVAGNFYNPNLQRVKICVRAGTYTERVLIPAGKNYITLIGQGRSTIITASNSQSQVGDPYSCATLVVYGDYFLAAAIVIQNTHYSVWDPSPAVSLLGTQSQFYVVGIKGWMDTLAVYTGQHYFKQVYVEGLADYVWGFGRAVFDGAELYTKAVYAYRGYVTAQGQDWTGGTLPGGFVFWQCKVDGAGPTYLGRPYRSKALVVFAGCSMAANVLPVGWSDWHGAAASGQVQFLEYASTGPGAAPSHRQLGRQISQAVAYGQYSPNAFISLNHWQASRF
eukprot:SM000007S20885  [mRNA]  locus=s7:726934:728710:- [translate_table: standard]